MKKQTERSILIVVAEAGSLQRLTRILTGNDGYRICAARTGCEAIETFHAERPDLVLLDTKLPDVSGFEVSKILKADEETSHVPIIFLSEQADVEDKRRSFEIGGADYISGPFINEELIAKVNTYFEMSRLREESEERADELERENNAIFRELFDKAPVGYHEIDATGRIVRVNETELEMLGYSRNEVIGQYIWQFAADEVLSQHTTTLKLGGELKPAESYERDFRRKDGTVVTVLVSDKLLQASDGKIIGIRSNVQDITWRKQMEKELQENEERLKFALSGTNDGVWDVNMETNAVYLSPRGCEILGYDPERLQEIVSQWSQLVHPDDMDATNAALDAYLEGKTPIFTVEQRLKMASGDWKWIHTRGKVVSYNSPNKPLRMVGTHTDITDRKLAEEALRQSEEKFKKVFATSPNCVNINRLEDGMYVALNPGFTNIIGYTEEEILGKTSIEKNIWYDVSDRKKWVEELNKNGKVRNFETQFRTKNGAVIHGLVSATLIELDGVKHVISITSDITERKLAEEALKEGEEKFRNIFEYSVAGKSITGFDGRLKVNKAFCDIVGYSKEELNRLTWKEITHPDDIEFKQREIELLVKGVKKFTTFESRFVHKSGSVVWVDLRTVLQKDDNGNPLYFFTSVIDITERRQAEKALVDSETKFRSLFENAPNPLCYVNESGALLLINRAFVKLFGYDETDLPTIAEWWEKAYPNEDYRKWAMTNWALSLEDASSNAGEIDAQLYTVTCRDGSEKDVLISAITISDRLLATFVDITARKRAEQALRDSEEKLSTLFGSMTEMMVMHELVFNAENKAVDYRIVDCNTAFSQITGIKKEDAIGKLGTEVYQREIPPYFEIYVQVATTGKSYEYDTYYAPMDKHFIISVVSPRKNVFATITTDITAIKQIQADITAKNKELENYLYVASHDLRSPLVNIQGFSQRLQKQSDEIKSLLDGCAIDKEKRERIDKIANEAMPKSLDFVLSNVLKMDSLISSLLQISRTGRLPLAVKKVDMNKLFKAIIAAQNYQITELGVNVVIPELSDCFGDENQLNQLFSNIIDNAIKYRDKNRQLAIEIDSIIHFDKKVIYRIKDTGLGISERNQKRIWDVFYRVDSKAMEGEGIGLSIAKTIANKHKGKIWVDSEEGIGSTFNVELLLREFSEQ